MKRKFSEISKEELDEDFCEKLTKNQELEINLLKNEILKGKSYEQIYTGIQNYMKKNNKITILSFNNIDLYHGFNLVKFQELLKSLQSYDNIKVIKIHTHNEKSIEKTIKILNSFKKIESLTIQNGKITKSDFEMKMNLKEMNIGFKNNNNGDLDIEFNKKFEFLFKKNIIESFNNTIIFKNMDIEIMKNNTSLKNINLNSTFPIDFFKYMNNILVLHTTPNSHLISDTYFLNHLYEFISNHKTLNELNSSMYDARFLNSILKNNSLTKINLKKNVDSNLDLMIKIFHKKEVTELELYTFKIFKEIKNNRNLKKLTVYALETDEFILLGYNNTLEEFKFYRLCSIDFKFFIYNYSLVAFSFLFGHNFNKKYVGESNKFIQRNINLPKVKFHIHFFDINFVYYISNF
jgi:hypothetical protein